ncbi:Arm DNA-binding domain-containing protein [Shouchella lonarensis]|uniref:AP2-like DNA-binding integrase domain-containing protein n=1 Tax=Shouchella lonarensis TaxID=1464122 RepID=A0A1G6GIH2_9BACI|nr:AP2-like DNA-binding integrase domain-containing protein [Shouchella lonarensis]
MATFYKRGKTWQYHISRMVNGKQDPIRQGGFRTKAEAEAAALEVESKLKLKGITPHLKLEPFDSYFQDWFDIYKAPAITKSTKEHYHYTLKAIKDHFGSHPIQHIRKRDYQKFLNKYGSTRSKETVEKVHIHIRACVQ